MDKPPKTNPAGRLYHLLKAARPQTSNATFGEVWAEVFGIDPEDRGRLLVMLSHLLQQIEEGKQAVLETQELRQDLHLEPFQKLEKAFSVMNLDGQFNGWKKGHLPDGTLRDLEWCAEALSGIYSEGEIDREELAELQDDIQDLTKKTREADIPEDIRGVILDGLEHIRRAIFEYDLRGVDGLKDALEQNIGAIVLRQQGLDEGDPAWDLVKEWTGRLAKLAFLIDSATQAYPLLAEGSELVKRLVGN